MAQLLEYWDNGLTTQDYSELEELPYESTRCWIRVLQKARQRSTNELESLEQVDSVHYSLFEIFKEGVI